jgi:pyruvate/2-oxoglutarate dehydrogenase complex dihydrolipoamide dehydrogenase (E3) component
MYHTARPHEREAWCHERRYLRHRLLPRKLAIVGAGRIAVVLIGMPNAIGVEIPMSIRGHIPRDI